jgi:D-alanine-D-alanine ligase
VYGYEAKWLWDTADHQLEIYECPARVPQEVAREVERVALAAYHALGCRDWCRVDVRLDGADVPNVVELNPLPGILPDPRLNSCFPKAARVAGFSYDELIQEVVRIAWRRITGQELAPRAGAGAAAPRSAVGAPHYA